MGEFDPEFFGISPHEARSIDPQHRLLVEVAWEACEHAGLPISGLKNSNTGHFAGMCNNDHSTYLPWLPGGVDPYLMTGNQFGAGAGRVSHLLGLRGPAMAVDTSCSSGLVAAHLARQSLQLGECDLALASAVSLMLNPGVSAAFNELGVLSPTGSSKTFDRSADGYTRAEGCVVLVMKRLADAVRDGDRVLAVLRGTAVNHDGSTSRFTLTSAEAQRGLIETTLRRAGVTVDQVGMVEAHGTGTRAGDLVELTALNATYGQRSGLCALGSVKTNLGHTEAVAGLVGLLKAVLAVHHGKVPASRNFEEFPEDAPPIDGLFVPTRLTDWPVTEGPRLAAVCSYGVGGTNAHAIVEQPPAAPRPAAPARHHHTFLLSAGSQAALASAAVRLADWLEHRGLATPLHDIAHTLAVRRSHATERLAVVASTRAELITRLRSYAEHGTAADTTSDHRRVVDRSAPVWVFSGHGSQWPGMGRELLRNDNVFADAAAEVSALVEAEAGFSPVEVLLSGEEVTRVDRVQPLIFTVHVALARTLEAMGIRPGAVTGHSMGEVAAAVVAGGLTTADGVKVICRRSRLCVAHSETGVGAMATVELAASVVAEEIAGIEDVDVAVYAAPGSTVIGGRTGAVRALVEAWQERDVPARMIAVDFASHCGLAAPLAAELETSLTDLRPMPPTVPYYSATAPHARQPVFDAAYWAANLRQPVQAVASTTALTDDGFRLFQEISPHPVARHPLTATLTHLGVAGTAVLPTLHHKQDVPTAALLAVAHLHCVGHDVDWSRWYGTGGLVDLPPTTWERRRHLVDLASVGAGPAAPVLTPTTPEPEPERSQDALAELRAAPSTSARTAVLEAHVSNELRRTLGLHGRRISPAAKFSELGLDSLHAVRLRNGLRLTFGVTVPLDAIWRHDSPGALGAHLARLYDEDLAGWGRESAGEGPTGTTASARPATARSRFTELPSGRFHYLHWGRPSESTPQVVLLHANAASAASWSRVGPALAGRFEVFALDLRGHGGSVAPGPGSYHLPAVADDVAAFLSSLGLRAPVLVGHSWGAAVALTMASGAGTHPAPTLAGLVLEDPPATMSGRGVQERLDALLTALSLGEADLAEAVRSGNPGWDEADRTSLAADLRRANPDVAAHIVHDGAAAGPLLPLFERLSTPALVLRASPEHGGVLSDGEWARLRSALPAGCRTAEIPGATHEMHRSRFDEFVRVMCQFADDVTTPVPVSDEDHLALSAAAREPQRAEATSTGS
ncbi:acyl transferase domain-containing protein/pimeloyl-ACP methyl ester carboxylesterase [Crossiella equi]|uniref:Acyl transferase domain-containing protein/pimeloyl-ACP methyl ester carboxylesterase n=1 Tax=Crossiella equi TaxID=130796 RepID=A0ABS5ASK6_9PSEU|nr:acyl transferase domain-containing protein/pimeloyl-ACP methyl ester carboxylesterase [Crossiella equi]